VVWDEEDWQRVPYQIRETLLELKRQLSKTSASRFELRVVKHG
jgi:hypothetical protein